MRRGERFTFFTLAVLMLALRALAFFRYRFDSDEPQHLHVAWAWTAGLLPYRDVFDNHAPLFHIVTAPLLRLAGERADVLLYMRIPMLLLFGVVVGATYLIGARFYTRRAGLWSALLLSLLPPFFFKSLEYRTDNLWNALWFVAVLILIGGRMTAARSFAAGILIGLAFATSMKTSLLVLSLVAAAVMTHGRQVVRRLRAAAAFLAGASIAPAIVIAWFASRHALGPLYYGSIAFNELLTHTKSPPALWLPRLAWIPAMAAAVMIASRHRPDHNDRWRFFFAFFCAFYFITLVAFWILVSPRDLLPCLPFLAIFGVGYVERHAKNRVAAYAVVATSLVALLTYYADGFANHTLEQITMMRQVLGVTRPGEPIIDYKGETIYRPRATYFILEAITRRAMKKGLLPDTIAEDVVRTRCHVAQADGAFYPPRGGAFLRANFIDLGRLRAAGRWIHSRQTFVIAIPGSYVIVDENGEAGGALDGTPYRGGRYLAAGVHRFDSSASDSIACLWEPAYRRGYSPFHLRDREF